MRGESLQNLPRVYKMKETGVGCFARMKGKYKRISQNPKKACFFRKRSSTVMQRAFDFVKSKTSGFAVAATRWAVSRGQTGQKAAKPQNVWKEVITMYVRRVKRKCGIRGCKNTDCFAVSRAREIGNTVIICRDCLAGALGELDGKAEPEKSATPKIQNKTKKAGVKK